MRAKVLAEALGTALLVATVVGSGVMAARLTGDLALQLLCNGFATAAMLYVLITALGPVSGAHFNPVVSLVMAWRRALPRRAVLPYVAAQVAGGIAGTFLAHAMFDLPIWQLASTARASTGQWISEIVASAGLIIAILCALRTGAAVAPVVAAQILAAYWFTASTSFANPAVTIARSLTDSFSGILPAHAPAFIAAQLLGGALGLWLFTQLDIKEKPPT